MTKISDSELVKRIGGYLVGEIYSPGKEPNTDELRLFFDVYCFDMEIGSGGSFDQYFQWATKEQIDRILDQLKEIGLESIADSTKSAIEVAFPHGVPNNEDEFDECLEWTEEQEDVFVDLYENDENIHSLIEEKLAKYARKNSLLTLLQ